MCRRTEEEVGPTVGLPRHRHIPVNSPDFVGILPIFNPLSRLSPDRLKTRDFSRFVFAIWNIGPHFSRFLQNLQDSHSNFTNTAMCSYR